MADTQEVILNRMLGTIPDKYYKAEGSFFYDVLNATAIEIEKLNFSADGILDKGFADTTYGKYLERKAGDQGLTRKATTKASGVVTVTGTPGAAIIPGQCVASESAIYAFTQSLTIPSSGSIDVTVECINYGAAGNVPIAAIKYFPKTLAGLKSVTNAAAFTNGTDEESDDSLRDRYLLKVGTPVTGGNKNDYILWATSVPGCGGAKPISLANGPGTVKVVIISSDKTAADSSTVAAVSSYIETVRPIDAIVQVVSATEKKININATIQIDSLNTTKAVVQAAIQKNIIEYLKTIAFNQNYISYAKIGTLIFGTIGVVDYSNLTVNSGTSNITIAETEIATLGGITLG